jgi:hypothetical protein
MYAKPQALCKNVTVWMKQLPNQKIGRLGEVKSGLLENIKYRME